MTDVKPSCSICAYRETCSKKYSITDPSRCLEFTPDVTLDIKEEHKG